MISDRDHCTNARTVIRAGALRTQDPQLETPYSTHMQIPLPSLAPQAPQYSLDLHFHGRITRLMAWEGYQVLK